MILITILNAWSCCVVWLAWYHHVALAGVTLVGVLLPQSQGWHPIGQCLQEWAPAPTPTCTHLTFGLFKMGSGCGIIAGLKLEDSCLGLTCVRNTGEALHPATDPSCSTCRTVL